MAEISTSQKRGLQDPYSVTSPANALSFAIEQKLRHVQTNFIGCVKECDGTEEKAGSGKVSVLPLVAQTDAEHNALPMQNLVDLPYTRYQYGVCALVIDPAPGDIMVLNVTKNDSKNIKPGMTEPLPPASYREFSQSDAVAAGAIHTQTPQNWITLRQDLTREGYAPEGIKDRTDKDLVIQVGQNVTITVGQNEEITISGNFTGTVQGNASLTVNGNCSLTVNGTTTVNSTGAVSVTSSAGATVQATDITLDAPTITATGNMTIAGTLTAANGTMHAGGGSFSMQGSISATGDVQGGGISLTSHTHTAPHGETSGPH